MRPLNVGAEMEARSIFLSPSEQTGQPAADPWRGFELGSEASSLRVVGSSARVAECNTFVAPVARVETSCGMDAILC